MEPTVQIQRDPRGGYVVQAKWGFTDDHERTVFGRASTHVEEADIAIAVALGCNHRGSRNPFEPMGKRGA